MARIPMRITRHYDDTLGETFSVHVGGAFFANESTREEAIEEAEIIIESALNGAAWAKKYLPAIEKAKEEGRREMQKALTKNHPVDTGGFIC